MKHPRFSDSELSAMKSFYRIELEATVNKLEHIQSVLSKLEGSHKTIEIKIASPTTNAVLTNGTPIQSTATELTEEESASTEVAKRHKKRGPKSVWGAFIIKRLRQIERPITYVELIEDAMAFMKLPQNKQRATRDAIMNSAFRLRNVHKKIDTQRVKGKREVYIGLSKWFDGENGLGKEYVKRIK